MKLIKAKIENYRCILDSEEFTTNQITCLVGKNEAGKSSVLKALYRLNPDVEEEANFDPVIEYPRNKWSEYKEHHKTNPDNVITSYWNLNEDEINAIKKILGEKSLKSAEIIIKKGYDNVQHWTIPLNESEITKFFIESSSLFKEEREILFDKKSINELISHLELKGNPTENEKNFLKKLIELFPSRSSGKKAIEILKPHMPTFLYFTDYYKMLGNVSINDLNQRIKNSTLEMGHRIFIALLDLVGTTPSEIDAIGRSEALIAELEAVSLRLSEEIFNYWSQNRYLKVKFMFTSGRPNDPPPLNSGNVFRTRIENTRHGVSVNFDERSSGFVWFFSFLVWFSQVRRNYGEDLFILLDDPGLTLHARAQADLLKYIRERLMPNYQIMYTTHSPFLVDPDHLLDVRTVEDVVKDNKLLGTKISDQILTIDPDTIFPLQAALGYDITQTLFVGKNNLLVEGPSDLLYLKWFSHELKSKNRVSLDPRWVIVPCGEIGKVSPFMSLFGSNSLNVAVFTDYHSGIKGKVKSLIESQLLEASKVFTADIFVNNDEADIEDMIGRHCYISLINECYHLDTDERIPYKKPVNAPVRVILEVEEHFKKILKPFDHYTPSLYLTEDSIILSSKLPKIEEALNRFESLFKRLNAVIS